MRHRAILSSAALALVVNGCSYVDGVYARATYGFQRWQDDPQILYEAGAEDLAKLAAVAFAPGIETVEQRQYLPFKNKAAIRVYVFNDRKHYAAFSRTSILTRGSSTTDEVYLSEKLRELPATLPSILAHELSHVHIRQYTGTLRYVSDVPSWFAEGMAVSVSDGGGAENVTPQGALAAIRDGIRFAPKDSGSFFGAFRESSNGLEPHMYYREASLFVEHLHQTKPDEFRATFVGILRGESFRGAWSAHYGTSISDLWVEFVADSRTGSRVLPSQAQLSGAPIDAVCGRRPLKSAWRRCSSAAGFLQWVGSASSLPRAADIRQACCSAALPVRQNKATLLRGPERSPRATACGRTARRPAPKPAVLYSSRASDPE